MNVDVHEPLYLPGDKKIIDDVIPSGFIIEQLHL